jgi:hypothetical protein
MTIFAVERGVAEGWIISVRPIVWDMKKYNIEARRKRISYILVQ